jgi:hypothetical protein
MDMISIMDVENKKCTYKINIKHLEGIDHSTNLGLDGFQPYTSELFSYLSSKNINYNFTFCFVWM